MIPERYPPPVPAAITREVIEAVPTRDHGLELVPTDGLGGVGACMSDEIGDLVDRDAGS
jgi:hypothetical protein